MGWVLLTRCWRWLKTHACMLLESALLKYHEEIGTRLQPLACPRMMMTTWAEFVELPQGKIMMIIIIIIIIGDDGDGDDGGESDDNEKSFEKNRRESV
jgi:hypothetical protein